MLLQAVKTKVDLGWRATLVLLPKKSQFCGRNLNKNYGNEKSSALKKIGRVLNCLAFHGYIEEQKLKSGRRKVLTKKRYTN